ncbi:MAG: ABC transporter [Treponema sp.]|nr:MAG: ABC transporter [Treponema sp.]
MKTRRNSFSIMLSLITLLKPLLIPMLIAITVGVLGFIATFGIAVFGAYAIFSILPEFNLVMSKILLGGFATKTYLILLITSGFLRGVLRYIEQYCNHLLAFKILAMIRSKVFSAMQKLAPAKLDRKNPGQLISLITGDIELLEVFYAHTISPIAIALITAILLFIFYFTLHPILTVIPLLSQIIIGIILPVIASKRGEKTSVEIREKIGKLNGQFIDKLRGVREVLQYNCEESTLKTLEEVTEALLIKQTELKKQAANLSAIVDSAIMIFSIAQALTCLYLIQNGFISIPTGVITTLLTAGSFAPYISLANLGNTLTQTFACGDRVLSILEEEPVIQTVNNGKTLIDKTPEAKLQNISFGYGKNQPTVLENLDLEIPSGKILGIMGKSGSGKSTILKLLLRFWDPCKGSIKINDTELPQINTGSIYEKINYMTQATQLFTGTIRSNLLIAKKDATDEQIVNALKKASVYEYIMSLPDGLESKVGESGVNFSGGERQRLGLARCLLADKPMLLLDEPTSNIDSINEALILRAIKKDSAEKTVVLVSHRNSTLAICDKITEIKK